MWLNSILPGLLVQLVHREIDDPAESEGALLDQPKLVADAGARLAGEALGLGLWTGGKKNDVAAVQPRELGEPGDFLALEIVGDRTAPNHLRFADLSFGRGAQLVGGFGLAALKDDVAEPGGAHLGFRPLVHPVEERGTRPGRCSGSGDGPDDSAALDDAPEGPEFGAGETPRRRRR